MSASTRRVLFPLRANVSAKLIATPSFSADLVGLVITITRGDAFLVASITFV